MTMIFRDYGRWFFTRSDARVAALLRIGFCVSYLLMLWDFRPVMSLLFGRAGLYGTLERYPYQLDGLQFLLFRHDSPGALQLWFWLSVAAAVSGVLGWKSRFSVALTYFSMLLFRERGPFITFGADLVLNCVGLWMLFLDSGRAWSLDSLGSTKRVERVERVDIEGWPIRAIQLQIALVYLVTGLAKLMTQPWQDGSAVYYALYVGSVTKTAPPDWLVGRHWLMASMTYGTLAIELSAPFFLLLYRPLRPYAIAACVMLHSGIDLLMSIRFFSVVMYVGLASFIEAPELSAIGSSITRLQSRMRAVPLAALAQRRAPWKRAGS